MALRFPRVLETAAERPVTAAADPLAHRLAGKLALALAIALTLAFVLTLASGTGPTTGAGRIGGDYPAFYVGGSLVRSDQRASLYDPAVQSREEAKYLPPDDHGYLYFPYPPHVALAYSPLTLLPYRWSYAAYTLLMFGALALSLRLMRPMVPLVDRHFGVALVGALTFYPMYRAVTGGQNTALSLLLMTASWRALHDDRELAAGIYIGVLLYKPQLAVPLLGLHLLARRRRTLQGAAFAAIAGWVVSAAVMGVGWTSTWWHNVRQFSAIDDHVNRSNVISFLSLAHGFFADAGRVATTAAALLALATGVTLARTWHRRGHDDLTWPMAVAAPALLLLSPHALFYEAGLLVISFAVLLSSRRVAAKTVGLLWLAGLADVAKDAIGFTPVFVVTLLVFAVALGADRQRAPRRQPVQGAMT